MLKYSLPTFSSAFERVRIRHVGCDGELRSFFSRIHVLRGEEAPGLVVVDDLSAMFMDGGDNGVDNGGHNTGQLGHPRALMATLAVARDAADACGFRLVLADTTAGGSVGGERLFLLRRWAPLLYRAHTLCFQSSS